METRYYRPNIGWWPKPPAKRNTGKEWNESKVLDWSTGLLLDREECKKAKLAMPGLRTRTLKSSDVLKYHVGGPYNGAKLRKWIKRRGRTSVEILLDEYSLPEYNGRYKYDEMEDRYVWQNQ